MRNRSVQFKVLWVTAFVYLLTLMDKFMSPSIVKAELCTEIFTEIRPFSKYQKTYYYLHTDKNKYSIDEKMYYAVSVGQYVMIGRSALTGANRFIEVLKDNRIVRSNIEFVSDSGLVVLIFFSVVTILFMIFYDRIPYIAGRMNLTIFVAVIAVLLFVFHLRGALEL